MNQHEQHRRTYHFSCCENQHGVVLVFVALLLIVLLGIAALAVDIGYVAITRNQLQNASDAAALAGAGKLGMIYESQDPPLSLNSSQEGEVKDVALYVGLENEVAGQAPNIVKSSDVIVGYWDSEVNTFYDVPPSVPIPRIQNAVRVTDRPSGGGSIPLGSVTTFFARVLGTSDVPVSATATASLTAPCNILPGGLSPFVIAKDSPYCTTMPSPDIDFTGNDPDHPPCGGWTSLDAKSNANSMQDFLDTLMSKTDGCTAHCDIGEPGSPNFDIVGKEVGDTTNLINGLVDKLWPCLIDLYKCARNPTNKEWSVLVPVVDKLCGSLNQTPEIVSFATITIKGISYKDVVEGLPCRPGVNPPCVNASVVCDRVIPEKGGGCAYYGTYGSIPGIVDKTSGP